MRVSSCGPKKQKQERKKMKIVYMLLLLPAVVIDIILLFVVIAQAISVFGPGPTEGEAKMGTFPLTRWICRKLGWLPPAKPKK